MGRVFTPQQVESGHFPTDESHLKASQELLAGIEERGLLEQKTGEIALKGVLIYGSVAFGKPRIRSDLDVFGQYRAGIGISHGFKELIEQVDKSHHVGIEPNIRPDGDIRERSPNLSSSTLDNAMLSHLKAQDFNRWGVGQNPLDEYSWHDIVPSRLDLFKYIAVKEDSFSKALHSSEITPKELQRAMEAPRALGRKFFQILEAEGLMPDAPDEADTPSIESKMLEYFDQKDEQIAREINQLIESDRNYTFLLEQAVSGGISELRAFEEYYDWLMTSSCAKNGAITLAFALTVRLKHFSKHLFAAKNTMHEDLLSRR